MAEPTFIFKIILLGNVGVGKSCLRERFATGQFKEMILQKPWQEEKKR